MNEFDWIEPPVSQDTLQSWWNHLREENNNYIKTRMSKNILQFAVSEKMINLIYTIGNTMGLSPDILLATVLECDKFLVTSYNKIQNLPQQEQREEMQAIRDNMLLTVCSLLQLVSKAISRCQLQVGDILTFIDSEERDISKVDIIKSEQHVFRTLKFKIPMSSPLAYVEVLASLVPARSLGVELPLLQTTCEQLMLVAYSRHQELYDSLLFLLTSQKECTPQQRTEFFGVELDQVFLAAAALLAAARLLGGHLRIAMPRVETLTNVPRNHLERLSELLLDEATSPSSPGASSSSNSFRNSGSGTESSGFRTAGSRFSI